MDGGHVIRQGPRSGVQIDENQPAPDINLDREEGKGRRIKSGRRLVARRGDKATVQLEAPAVQAADEAFFTAAPIIGDERPGPVRTKIAKRPQHPARIFQDDDRNPRHIVP